MKRTVRNCQLMHTREKIKEACEIQSSKYAATQRSRYLRNFLLSNCKNGRYVFCKKRALKGAWSFGAVLKIIIQNI